VLCVIVCRYAGLKKPKWNPPVSGCCPLAAAAPLAAVAAAVAAVGCMSCSYICGALLNSTEGQGVAAMPAKQTTHRNCTATAATDHSSSHTRQHVHAAPIREATDRLPICPWHSCTPYPEPEHFGYEHTAELKVAAVWEGCAVFCTLSVFTASTAMKRSAGDCIAKNSNKAHDHIPMLRLTPAAAVPAAACVAASW